jgi:hypothetical protein
MEEGIPFAGWVDVDKEDTEEMLRHQMHIIYAELQKLREENMRLISLVHDLESRLYGGSVL